MRFYEKCYYSKYQKFNPMEQIIIKKNFKASKKFCSNVEHFLCKKFNVPNISLLHQSSLSPLDRLQRENDQYTSFHKTIYKSFDNNEGKEIISSYRDLCKEWLFDLIAYYNIEKWAIQRFPNLRFQVPSNVSVFEFHMDSTYHHPLGEINHFIAINDCRKSASLHVEKHLGWEDYEPLNLNARQSALLNTSIFKHGDFQNNENYTRVSADFRAIPQDVLEKQQTLPTMDSNKSFSIDDYFIGNKELLSS